MKAPHHSNFFGKKMPMASWQKKSSEHKTETQKPREHRQATSLQFSYHIFPMQRKTVHSFLISLLAKEVSESTLVGRKLQGNDNSYYETDTKPSFMSRTQRQSLSILASALRDDTTSKIGDNNVY